MKRLLLIAIVVLNACTNKNELLTKKQWILFSKSSTDSATGLYKDERYGSDISPVQITFNADGSFIYIENNIPKGVEPLNRWSLQGDKLTMHWHDAFINETNTLTITTLDTAFLIFKNENTAGALKPVFTFYPQGSALQKLKGILK